MRSGTTFSSSCTARMVNTLCTDNCFTTGWRRLFKFLLHLGEVGEFGVDSAHPFPISALFWYFILTFSLMTVTYGVGAPPVSSFVGSGVQRSRSDSSSEESSPLSLEGAGTTSPSIFTHTPS